MTGHCGGESDLHLLILLHCNVLRGHIIHKNDTILSKPNGQPICDHVSDVNVKDDISLLSGMRVFVSLKVHFTPIHLAKSTIHDRGDVLLEGGVKARSYNSRVRDSCVELIAIDAEHLATVALCCPNVKPSVDAGDPISTLV